MNADDETRLEQVAFAQLFAWRFSGVLIAITGLLFVAFLAASSIQGVVRHESLDPAALLVAAVAFAVAGLGAWLYRRGRRPRRSTLFRLLSSDVTRVRSLKFVGLVNHPYSHVYLGIEGRRDWQIVFPGAVEQARAFFTRIAPHARVEAFPDRRTSAPSRYER